MSDVYSMAEICQRKDEFGLDTKSMVYLWCMSRLLGASLWYLAQVEDAPELGFFVPRIPGIIVVNSRHGELLQNFYSGVSSDFPSTVIQLPVDFDFLVKNLEARNMFQVGRQATELAKLRRIANLTRVTNFIICDSVRDAFGPVVLHILAWPHGFVTQGFDGPAYPGWQKTDIESSRIGWDPQFDKRMLQVFVLSGLRQYASSLEYRMVHGYSIGPPEPVQAHASPASSTGSNEDWYGLGDHDTAEDSSEDGGNHESPEPRSVLGIGSDTEDDATSIAGTENNSEANEEAKDDVEDKAEDESESEVDEGTDGSHTESDGWTTVEYTDEDVEADANEAEDTTAADDALEDETTDSDCSSSDNANDKASEYAPSEPDRETEFEYQQLRVSRREQNALTQWPQDPASDAEEDDLPEPEADEIPDFEGMVIANQEMFDQLVAMVTPPPASAHNGAQQAGGVGTARLETDTRIEPSYYEEAGAFGYGFEPDAGYASNAYGHDLDMTDLGGIFEEADYDADLMDTSAG